MSHWRLGVLVTHPIQYYAPWFRHLAERMDVEVFCAHRQDGTGQARAGFGMEFEWDVPLLEGYRYRWLQNVARRPGVGTFSGCDTPEIHEIVSSTPFDAFLIIGWNYRSALQAVMACRREGVPVLMRGDSQLATKRPLVTRALKYVPYRFLLPRLSAHLYVGKRNRAYLEHYGVPERKLFFVPHVVDNEFFATRAQKARETGKPAAIRKELGIPADAFVFLLAGKMTPKKRPFDFLSAFVRASREDPTLHALLVGDGPLRPSLERLAESDPSRVHFAGFVNQARMPAFYGAADALVLTSDARETWGLVVNEAAASGIPAVVSDAAGCAPDLIDELERGLTYPVGAVDALERNMLTLRSICRRTPLRVQSALRRKMEAYSFERAAEGLERALEAVASRTASPRRASPVSKVPSND